MYKISQNRKKCIIAIPIPNKYNSEELLFSEGLIIGKHEICKKLNNKQDKITYSIKELEYNNIFLVAGLTALQTLIREMPKVTKNNNIVNNILEFISNNSTLDENDSHTQELLNITVNDLDVIAKNYLDTQKYQELMQTITQALNKLSNNLQKTFDSQQIPDEIKLVKKDSKMYYLTRERLEIIFSFFLKYEEELISQEQYSSKITIFKPAFIQTLDAKIPTLLEGVNIIYIYGDYGNIAPPGIPPNGIRFYTERRIIEYHNKLKNNELGLIATCGGIQKVLYQLFPETLQKANYIPQKRRKLDYDENNTTQIHIQQTESLKNEDGKVFQHCYDMSKKEHDRKIRGRVMFSRGIDNNTKAIYINKLKDIFGQDNFNTEDYTVNLPPCEHNQSAITTVENIQKTQDENPHIIFIVHHDYAQPSTDLRQKLSLLQIKKLTRMVNSNHDSYPRYRNASPILDKDHCIIEGFINLKTNITAFQCHFDGLEIVQFNNNSQLKQKDANSIGYDANKDTRSKKISFASQVTNTNNGLIAIIQGATPHNLLQDQKVDDKSDHTQEKPCTSNKSSAPSGLVSPLLTEVNYTTNISQYITRN
ncbi:MAG: hypothetical protein P857_1056 [Candidatus Xenolissoclinum pacificiensis L6]|uniref:Uncharacterized protein n=1 Tax=Candidatus Xenolissoclinum pacificiensis L6 TaxID=1401685 RepID=W2V2J3_9RICK|nr:MAG: hypothetical protein P857_1056 [Candidatus Xenolissoclinum pacificiensis L6]